MGDLTFIKDFKNTESRTYFVNNIIKELGKDSAYELATSILYRLESEHYCIWQTYTKEDIKDCIGKRRLTDSEMDEYGDMIQNFFNRFVLD